MRASQNKPRLVGNGNRAWVFKTTILCSEKNQSVPSFVERKTNDESSVHKNIGLASAGNPIVSAADGVFVVLETTRSSGNLLVLCVGDGGSRPSIDLELSCSLEPVGSGRFCAGPRGCKSSCSSITSLRRAGAGFSGLSKPARRDVDGLRGNRAWKVETRCQPSFCSLDPLERWASGQYGSDLFLVCRRALFATAALYPRSQTQSSQHSYTGQSPEQANTGTEKPESHHSQTSKTVAEKAGTDPEKSKSHRSSTNLAGSGPPPQKSKGSGAKSC